MSKLDPVISIRVTYEQKDAYNADPIKGKIVRETVRGILDGQPKGSPSQSVELIDSYRNLDFATPMLSSERIVVVAYDILAFIKAPSVLSALRHRARDSEVTSVFIPVIDSISPEQELGISTLRQNLSRFAPPEDDFSGLSIRCFYPTVLTASRFIFFDGHSMVTAVPAVHNDIDQIDYRCIRFPSDTSDHLFTDLINIPIVTRCGPNLLREWYSEE